MKASRSGGGFTIDTRGLKYLADDLRALGPEATVAVRTGIRNMLGVVAKEARNRAERFSERIPGSIRVRVSPRGLSGSVSAGSSAAPDAAPIENRGKGHVRHPVFVPRANLPGPPGSWTDKNSPPAYLAPALQSKTEELQVMIDDLLEVVIEAFCRE